MHRIDGDYHASNMFTDISPGTRITASWLNTIQEELVYLLTQAGITPLTSDTDTRTQLYTAITTLVNPPTYISTMTGHETFTAASLYQKGRSFILDPNGSDRNFNPSGSFSTGYIAYVLNKGTLNDIIFDSTDLATSIIPGALGVFMYDGSNWR